MPSDFTRLGPELRRVRAAERAEPDGGKKVWHQAGSEVDVLSFVDASGRVTRQECHLGERAVIWRSQRQVSTATVSNTERGLGIAASALEQADGGLDHGALRDALVLLRATPRGDRYLDHLLGELEAAEAKLDADVEDTVTSIAPQQARTTPPAPPARSSRPLVIGVAVAILAIGLLAAMALR